MVRVGAVFLASLVFGVTSCSIAYSQSLDFQIDGPSEVDEGEYVELRVECPDGVAADVSFVPVEEDRFGVHPIVRESIVDGKLVLDVRGRVCTFAARCRGERELTIVATAFASVEGLPRVHSLRHRIRVNSAGKPAPKDPPQNPLPPPPNEDDLGPRVPLPDASTTGEDLHKIVRVLGNVVDRLETLERRAAAPIANAPLTPAIRVPVAPAPIADAKPGHWSVATAANVWRPTKPEAIAHLRQAHPSTALRQEPLEALSLDQILSLHDDAHEGRLTSTTVEPRRHAAAPWSNACPGGVCPTSLRSSYTTGPLGVIRWRR